MEGVSKFLRLSAAKRFESEIKAGAFSAISERVLETARISPHFTLEEADSTLFAESRERLRTEPGLLISNHPGHFDSYIALSQIARNDIKIVVSEDNYKDVVGHFGDVPLIKATSDRAEGRHFFASIEEHVQSGGLVLFYPTGGGDNIENKDASVEFQRGFSSVLKYCLRPTDMVYSFYIEPSDIHAAVEGVPSRFSTTASAIVVPQLEAVSKLSTPVTITAHERYASASEWQSVMAKAGRQSREEHLSHYFLSQFPERREK